jgi:uncharacterized membrane protein
MAQAAIPIALALAGASTAYQVASSEQAKKKAKAAEREQQALAQKQEKEFQDKEAQSNAKRNTDMMIASGRLRTSLSGTKRPTTTTSPIGLPGGGGQMKTLLGS